MSPLRCRLVAEIFHLALRPDWAAARAAGGPYETSTRGRTLGDVGFIHACSDLDQVARVRSLFYADRDDLVLLVIDTDRLDAPVRYESADGDTFPHIYGPLAIDAVVEVRRPPASR